MPAKKIDKAEDMMDTQISAGQKDNSWIIIFFTFLSAFIVISAMWLFINWWNILWIRIPWIKEIAKNAVMDVEYSKVWGKENYDIIAKAQLQQIEQYVSQYKTQWTPNTATTDNWTAQTDWSDLKTMDPQDLKTLKENSYFEWNKDAKITIYEFSDLECPFCIRQFKEWTIKAMLDKFWDKINTAFKNFPLDFHKNSAKEAEATLCVWQIAWAEKYIDFHKKIFERTTWNGEWFSLDNLAPLAKEIWVNETKFKDCFDNAKTADALKADEDLWKKFGVTGTPGSVIVNNETGKYVLIAWAYPASEFEAKINELLK